jgi:hypothetical protein
MGRSEGYHLIVLHGLYFGRGLRLGVSRRRRKQTLELGVELVLRRFLGHLGGYEFGYLRFVFVHRDVGIKYIITAGMLIFCVRLTL